MPSKYIYMLQGGLITTTVITIGVIGGFMKIIDNKQKDGIEERSNATVRGRCYDTKNTKTEW